MPLTKNLSLVLAGLVCCAFTSRLRAQPLNQIVASGYSLPLPLANAAPGQIVTLFVSGLNVPDATASSIPLPTTLSGVTVQVKGQIANYPTSLPIFGVFTEDFCAGRLGTSCPLTQVTVEIPTEPACNGLNSCPAQILVSVSAAGSVSQSFSFSIVGSQPHIVNSCDTIFGIHAEGFCYPLVTHADGTLVPDSDFPGGRFARPGETITFYAVGLGSTDPQIPTGQASLASTPATIPVTSLPLLVSYQLIPPPATPPLPATWVSIARWIYPAYVGLVAGYVGLYQVNVTLPDDLSQAAPGAGDCPLVTRLAIGAGIAYSAADNITYVDFCVQPTALSNLTAAHADTQRYH